MQIAAKVAAAVADGSNLDDTFVKEAALRCQIIKDIEELQFLDIEGFYEEQNEPKTIEPEGENDEQ